MRHRMRIGRQPSDKELKADAEARAALCAMARDIAGDRAAHAELRAIEARALAAQKEHAKRPKHPMNARQEALWINAYRLEQRSYLRLGLLKVPPHPTKREERAFTQS